MLSFQEILQRAVSEKDSDIFIISGQPLSYKTGSQIVELNDEKVMPDTARTLISEAYAIANRDMKRLIETGDDDFAVSVQGMARFRI
ncbi:MAG: type IV pili twitching motility protein PilT, partial [Firmicutes bacterium]|nr:type IV pili twitching motility protein PilT [Bacillota bacterium]